MTYFDSEAQNYDNWYESPLGSCVDRVETEAVMRLLRPEPGELILDVGCGTGNFTLKLARLGCGVTGVDISSGMLAKAREKAKGFKVDFRLCDSTSLPFPDDSFDSAVSVTAFEFMPDRKKSLMEMMRVVRPGGRVVVGTINRKSSWGELYRAAAKEKETVFRYADLLGRDDLQNLSDSGFSEITEVLFFPPDADVSPGCLEIEKNGKKTGERGGFLCAVWIK